MGGAGGGSSSHCRCLRGSDREELSLPGVLSRASGKGSARKGIRTFWELQGGQGVQKRVPAGKTGGAGEDRVAGSLSDQLKPYGSVKRLDEDGSGGVWLWPRGRLAAMETS